MKKILLILSLATTSAWATSGTVTFKTGGSGTYSIQGGGNGTVFIGTPLVAPPPPGGTYAHYRTLTISSTNVSNVLGVINNFPVLVSTNNVVYSTTTGSGGKLSTGYDLVFTTNAPGGTSGAYTCPYGIHWDTETPQNVGVSSLTVWVNLPVLSTATSTAATFYMCYGNSSVTTYVGASTATWPSQYGAVYHLSGSGPSGVDSTVNANNATTNTATAATGIADGGGNDSASVTGLLVPHSSSIEPTVVSVSAWLNYATDSQSAYAGMVQKGDVAVTPYGSYFLGNFATQPGEPYWQIGCADTNTNSAGDPTAYHCGVGAWCYAVGTFDGTNVKLYVNGALVGTGSHSPCVIDYGTTVPPNYYLTLLNASTGASPGTMGSAGFQGLMDEIRIRNDVENSDWILTEYNNVSSPNNFVTIGAEN